MVDILFSIIERESNGHKGMFSEHSDCPGP